MSPAGVMTQLPQGKQQRRQMQKTDEKHPDFGKALKRGWRARMSVMIHFCV